jgi:cytochrome P450
VATDPHPDPSDGGLTDTGLTDTGLTDVDLTDLDRFVDGFPHDVFTRLRREAPVWFHPPTGHTPGGEGFWVVSRHADCVAAASAKRTFSSETGPGRDGAGGTLIEDLPGGFAAGVLLNMTDDPRHQEVRRLLTPSLSPRALAALEDDLKARASAIVDAAAERARADEVVDLVVDVAAELPLQAIAHLLGVPQEDRHRLFAWSNATLDHDGRDLGEASERSQAAAAEMFAYGSALVAERRGQGGASGADLLSVAAASEAPKLSDLELQMFFNLLIAAGSETTRNSITLGLLALAEHPDQWRRLQDDRSLVPSAVEEILRWASTTPYNRRTATVDVELGGQQIAAGGKVTLWWASANRDEAVFDDPFRFDVARSPNPHLAFGHGSHFCLGATLARTEIRLVLDGVLDRFDGLEPAGPIERTRSNKHTGVRHAPVRFLVRD